MALSTEAQPSVDTTVGLADCSDSLPSPDKLQTILTLTLVEAHLIRLKLYFIF